MTTEQAEDWARPVEAAFDLWAKSRKCTRREDMNLYQSQRLAGIYQRRDNDYFVRLFYSQARDLLNPLQIGFIDPNQVIGDDITSTYGLQIDSDGIERDAAGREIAYKVRVLERDNKYVERRIPAVSRRTGLRMMLHCFRPEYGGQLRGYSPLAHAIQEFENITDFTSAQIKKAINQSQLVMSVVPSKDNPASDPFEDIDRNVSGPASALYGADPPPECEALSLEEHLQCYRLPEATFDTPGSTIITNLQAGEKVEPFVNSSPAQSFNTFVDSFTANISASMSIPVEVLLMRFNENYSASRAALILFWRIAQIWRTEMETDFLNPVYEMWLTGEIAAGRVQAPGWFNPRMRAAWVSNNWIGIPMPNIDPKNTAEAEKIYAELGYQTLERGARNHNGSNAAANRAKLKKELADLPPVPWSKGGGNGQSSGD
jgi:capsid protein